jgi:hypothetical protein
METTIGLMEFALKATIIGVRLTKKQMSHDEELVEASE